jgi:sulfotransferase family protein
MPLEPSSVDPGRPSPYRELGWRQLGKLAATGLVGDLKEQRQRRRALPRRPKGWRLARLSPRVRRPIFILGSPRSGTTFLGECVGSIPTVSYHFEPRLTKAAARQVFDGSWSSRRAEPVFRAFYGALLAANGDGGLRFAEKNPENCFIVPFLAEAFADAVFVQIVRDGRDAAVSHAEKPWLRAESNAAGRRGRGGTAWGSSPRFWVEPQRRAEFAQVSDLERTAWAWRRFTTAAVEGLSQLPSQRWLEVRYEQVVTAPAKSAQLIADFLELAPDGREALNVAMAAAVPSSVGRWRERLSAVEEGAVVSQCGPLLADLGYV